MSTPEKQRIIRSTRKLDGVCMECGIVPVTQPLTCSLCRAKNTERKRLIKRRLKNKAVEYFGGVCADCNTAYPNAVFDFHHKDTTKKLYTIALMHTSWPKLLLELTKCIMLCANCHRVRHSEGN